MSNMMAVGIHDPVTVTSTALDDQHPRGPGQVVVAFENEQGDYISAYWSLSDDAMPYTLEKLERCGYPIAEMDYDLLPLNKGKESPLVGFKTALKVKDEVWTDKTTGEVKTTRKVDWVGRLGPKTMAEPDAKDFAARLRAKVIAAVGPRPNAAPSAPPPIPPPAQRAVAGGQVPWKK